MPKEKTANIIRILDFLLCFMKIMASSKRIKVIKQRIKNGILEYAPPIIPRQKLIHKPTKGYFIDISY